MLKTWPTKSSGSLPNRWLNNYYTNTGDGPCGSQPLWAGNKRWVDACSGRKNYKKKAADRADPTDLVSEAARKCLDSPACMTFIREKAKQALYATLPQRNYVVTVNQAVDSAGVINNLINSIRLTDHDSGVDGCQLLPKSITLNIQYTMPTIDQTLIVPDATQQSYMVRTVLLQTKGPINPLSGVPSFADVWQTQWDNAGTPTALPVENIPLSHILYDAQKSYKVLWDNIEVLDRRATPTVPQTKTIGGSYLLPTKLLASAGNPLIYQGSYWLVCCSNWNNTQGHDELAPFIDYSFELNFSCQ